MSTRRPVAPDGAGGVSQIASPDIIDNSILPSLLPTAITATGRYDPAFHVYTPLGAQTLVKLPAKLAQSRKGVGRTKIAFMGPSTTAGWDGTSSLRGVSDYPTQVAEMFHAAGWDASEPLFTFCDAVANDLRGSITGTWTYSSHPAAEVFVAGFAGATLTEVCTRRTDTVEVTVLGTSAAFSVTIDGVVINASYPHLTTVNGSYSGVFAAPDGGAHFSKFTISQLPLTAHTVTITLVGGVVPVWIDCYKATGVSVANFGSSGSRTADWNDTSLYYTLLNEVIAWAPDVVVYDVTTQFNSWQTGEALATSLANLEATVATLQAAGIEVFLIGTTPMISPVTGTPPTQFWQNFFTLADVKGCQYLEQYTAWGSSEAVAAANGLIGGADTVHPSASGYTAIAKLLVDAWSITPWKRPLPLQVSEGTLLSALPSPLQPNTMTKLDPSAGTFAVVFPAAPASGTLIGLTHVGATNNTCTITPGGSDTITGTASIGRGSSQLWIYFATQATWLPVNIAPLDQVPTATADVSLGNHKITSLATPTVSTDAATMAYADLKLAKSTLAALGTGILKVTTGTGALSDAVAADIPCVGGTTNGPAEDSLVAHLAGTETLSGAKTFSGGITASTNPLNTYNGFRLGNTASITASGTLSATSQTCRLCDATSGAVAETLYNTTNANTVFFFVKLDSSANAVTIVPPASGTINGSASSITLAAQGDSCIVYSSGASGAWFADIGGIASNAVHIAGTEVVTGNKTFNGNFVFGTAGSLRYTQNVRTSNQIFTSTSGPNQWADCTSGSLQFTCPNTTTAGIYQMYMKADATANTLTVIPPGVGAQNISGRSSILLRNFGDFVIIETTASAGLITLHGSRGGEAFQTPTTPPVSTTVYTNTSGVLWMCSLAYTLTPSVSTASDVKVEISLDGGSTYKTWGDPSYPLGAILSIGGEIMFPVPNGGKYRVTATNATIGALVAMG